MKLIQFQFRAKIFFLHRLFTYSSKIQLDTTIKQLELLNWYLIGKDIQTNLNQKKCVTNWVSETQVRSVEMVDRSVFKVHCNLNCFIIHFKNIRDNNKWPLTCKSITVLQIPSNDLTKWRQIERHEKRQSNIIFALLNLHSK